MYEKIIQDSIFVFLFFFFLIYCVRKTGMTVVVDVEHIYRLKMRHCLYFSSQKHRHCHAAVMLIDPTLEMFVQIYKPFRILLDLFYYITGADLVIPFVIVVFIISAVVFTFI